VRAKPDQTRPPEFCSCCSQYRFRCHFVAVKPQSATFGRLPPVRGCRQAAETRSSIRESARSVVCQLRGGASSDSNPIVPTRRMGLSQSPQTCIDQKRNPDFR
jgi:hypothetical protein